MSDCHKLEQLRKEVLFIDYCSVPESAEGGGGGGSVLLTVFVVLFFALAGSATILLLLRVRRQRQLVDGGGRLARGGVGGGHVGRKLRRMLMAGPTADCLAKLGLSGGEGTMCSPGGGVLHRRSKSLRERAGVDGRLERLSPSALGAGHRFSLAPLHTVLPVPNPDER